MKSNNPDLSLMEAETNTKMTRSSRWTMVLFCMTFLLYLVDADSATVLVSSPEELAAAIEAALPGSALVLANGVYKDLRVEFKAEGESESPVVLKAETPGNVIITGNSRLTVSGRYLRVEDFVFEEALGKCIVAFRGSENCQMTDCAFLNCGDPESTFSHMITLREGSRNNCIDHCYMEGNLSMGMGVIVAETDHENTHNRFTHNYYRDVVRRWHNGQEAVQVGQSVFSRDQSTHTLVEYCLFERVDGDVEIISNKSSDNTYRYNTFRECVHSELVLRGGNRATVEGNFFLDGKGGIRVHGKQHRITNNYFENLERALLLRHGDQAYEPIVDCMIANNMIINCTECAICLGAVRPQGEIDETHKYYQPPTRTVFRGNVIVGATGSLVLVYSERETVWDCNIAWPTADARPGVDAEGLQIREPQLVRINGIYHLPKRDSTEIEGVPLPEECGPLGPAGQDADGETGSGADEEMSEEPRVWRPLQPKDVGPRWMQGNPARAHRIRRD